MKPLVIFGTGDIARLAHRYFTLDAGRTVIGFTVDAAYRRADSFLDLPLVDFADAPRRWPPDQYDLFVALSYARMNALRADKFQVAKDLGYDLPSYVSPRCSFLTDTPVGENCFILEDNTVQPFVTIGNNVTLWSGNHIGHDSVIADHCFISSHVVVSGRVRIGPYCFLGVNATLRNAITVAPRTLIGAGAVIMEDTREGGVYVPQIAQRIAKASHEIDL
jgi:sugar O-acyltransferase (sialic acid O-acetyltransferase NeuD family)